MLVAEYLKLRKLQDFLISLLVLAFIGSGVQANAQTSNSDAELLLHVSSPDWREQIIYFVMIDRFADGNPDNNDQNVNLYRPTTLDYYNGGDIEGITEQLQYIKQLGATAVWLTPPNANLWWSESAQSAGYHGYWARNFVEVDEHYGTLESYKMLSNKLHRNNMYLIQDVVTNHTGEFFNYRGDYDPSDTTKNYQILKKNVPTSAPTQSPFHLNDRLNPEHVIADIYHWSPEISNYQDPNQEVNYQLSGLNDLNTSNPVVREALKESFSFWIEEVGVDSFRLDTAKYVETDFLADFMHSSTGVLATARKTGRDNFKVFGEIFETSPPFTAKAENKIKKYFGSKQAPILNGVIGFPLYKTIEDVFRSGQPTRQLSYRLNAQMGMYRDPFMVLNFIDNHDTKRFQTPGNLLATKQALALILTVPGIPVIYQGDEQPIMQSRQAMFKGGYLSETDQYDSSSELYQTIKELSKIRKSNEALTKGNIKILADNETTAGLFAFQRNYQDQRIVVLFNTAEESRLLANVDFGLQDSETLQLLYSNNTDRVNSKEILGSTSPIQIDRKTNGVTAIVDGRAIRVYKIIKKTDTRIDNNQQENRNTILINHPANLTIQNDNLILTGTTSIPNSQLMVIRNGRVELSDTVSSNASGDWKLPIYNQDYGRSKRSIQLFSSEYASVSERIDITLQNTNIDFSKTWKDAVNDDKGRGSDYLKPLETTYDQQMDIRSVKLLSGGKTLEITIEMGELRSDWIASNEFDHVVFNIFFDLPYQQGKRVLPQLHGMAPDGFLWDFGHKVYGWENIVYSKSKSSKNQLGDTVAWSPSLEVDHENNKLTVKYNANEFNIENWNQVNIYLSTWDVAGEGDYRTINKRPSRWQFSNSSGNGSYILDETEVLKIDY
jgi:glycosidase